MPICSGNTGATSSQHLTTSAGHSPHSTSSSNTSEAHSTCASVPTVLSHHKPPYAGVEIPAAMAAESLGYLGSAMLSHMATGVGALQRPLSNLYFHAMLQSGGVVSQLPRRLVTLSEEGLSAKSFQTDDETDDDTFEEEVYSSAQLKREARERARSVTAWQEPASRLTAGVRHHQSQILYVPHDRDSKVGTKYGSTTQLSAGQHPQTSGYRIHPSPPSGEEIFHPLSAVMFWDSVQFRSVRGEDKRLRFSFQSLQNNSTGADRNGRRNLFVLLDTRYHWLHSLHHQPIFACVVRRSSGVKAIDVHAFLCDGPEQANRLGARLSLLNSQPLLTKTDGKQENKGTFGYLPFGKETARSVEGQFQRRSGLRKMSGCAGTSVGAHKRHYGSTPALNMLFSVARTTTIDDTIPYDDAIYHSSMDLTRSGGESGTVSHGRDQKQVSSSLDSKLKASECLQVGSSLSVHNSNTPKVDQKLPGKKSTRKLFSLSDLSILKSSRSAKEANRVRKALGSDSMNNLAAPETRVGYGSVNSLSPLSPVSPTSQLSPSNRTNSNNRVFFLVQEDFSSPKLEASPDGNGSDGAINSRKSSESNEARITSGLVSSTSSDLHASLEMTSTPTILEGYESDGGSKVSGGDLHGKPVAHIQPQKQQGRRDQVVHVDVHRSVSIEPPERVHSSPSSPLVVNVPPGKRLSQIRFVYYDDAELSRPEPADIQSTESTSLLCSSKTSSNIVSETQPLRVGPSVSDADMTNENGPSDMFTDNIGCINNINSGSNDLSRPGNDINANVGNITVDVSNLNIRNEPYGFSYSVNDVTTNNQCIPLATPSEVRDVKRLELRRIVVPPGGTDRDYVQGKRLPRHSLADFTQFLRPVSALPGVGSQEMISRDDKVWKSSENLRIYANPRRDSSPVRADTSNHQSNASLYSGSSLSVNSISTENQLTKMMNWQFKCPPPSVTSDYHTLQPGEMAGMDSDTIRKENELKAEKKDAEIATELEILQQGTESVQRRRFSQHDARFESALEYFP